MSGRLVWSELARMQWGRWGGYTHGHVCFWERLDSKVGLCSHDVGQGGGVRPGDEGGVV